MLWFAFILVTLSHWKQHVAGISIRFGVVICFHFSNFEPLETAKTPPTDTRPRLWFAFILVTLSHWKQLRNVPGYVERVVICFHFSNFEPLETAYYLLKTINQWITKHIRIKKTDIVSIKNPAWQRDFSFRTTPIAVQEYSLPPFSFHKKVQYSQTAYP